MNTQILEKDLIEEEFVKKELKFRDIDETIEHLIVRENAHVLSTTNFQEVEGLKDNVPHLINNRTLNDVRYLNKFLEAINSKLNVGGKFVGKFEEYKARKQRIIPKIKPFNYIVHSGDIMVNRVAPKLPVVKKVYFGITKGTGRVLSKAEAYGRLYSCGFEIIEEEDRGSELYFIAQKIKKPFFDTHPSYGPLIKLRRIGENGNQIKVYKLRTMHPFSEYLQEYVFKKNELQEGGKFKNDFRISTEGKIFRKFWLDELPMFINLLKGEMKIVGVRPLSQQYFNLYPKELQEKRAKVKPGLLPPFYADLPKTLEEIISSELKYLDAYEKSPTKTDFRYLWMAVKNIAFRGARSK